MIEAALLFAATCYGVALLLEVAETAAARSELELRGVDIRHRGHLFPCGGNRQTRSGNLSRSDYKTNNQTRISAIWRRPAICNR